MTSVDLMRKHPPRAWWTACLIAIAVLFLVQTIFAVPLVFLFEYLVPTSGLVLGSLYSFVFGLLAILIINEKLNKRTDAALGFHRPRAGRNYLIGLLIGLAMIVMVVGAAVALGAVRLSVNPESSWVLVLVTMVAFAIQGMTEEVLCRGYIQSSIAASKGMWFAVLVQAVIFAVIHAVNPGMQLLPALNLLVFGFLFGLLYWYTDSIWLVGAMHFAWNFLLGPVIGIEVSGMALPSTLFTATAVGSDLLTGGAFGIEGSILTTIIGVIGCVILHVLIQQKRKQRA